MLILKLRRSCPLTASCICMCFFKDSGRLTGGLQGQSHLVRAHGSRFVQVIFPENSLQRWKLKKSTELHYFKLKLEPCFNGSMEEHQHPSSLLQSLTRYFLILFHRIWNSRIPRRALPSFWDFVKAVCLYLSSNGQKKQSAGKGGIRSALVAHLTENPTHLEMLFCSPE